MSHDSRIALTVVIVLVMSLFLIAFALWLGREFDTALRQCMQRVANQWMMCVPNGN